MPLLFYGRINERKRRLYSADLRPIETSVFDSFKIRHLAPYGPNVRELANLWWFDQRKHTAISWHDSRHDLQQPHGIKANESLISMKEQTVFIPGLIRQGEALEIMRTSFPRWLIPGPLSFRFNNQRKIYHYHD